MRTLYLNSIVLNQVNNINGGKLSFTKSIFNNLIYASCAVE